MRRFDNFLGDYAPAAIAETLKSRPVQCKRGLAFWDGLFPDAAGYQPSGRVADPAVIGTVQHAPFHRGADPF